MKKLSFVSLLLIGAMLLPCLGCERESGDISQDESTSSDTTAVVEEKKTFKLYQFEYPTGKSYPEGYNELEYRYIWNYNVEKDGADPLYYNFQTERASRGMFASEIIHWEEPREYYTKEDFALVVDPDDPTKASGAGGVEYQTYDEADKKLMLLSLDSLDYSIRELEFLEDELSSMRRVPTPILYSMRYTPSGDITAFFKAGGINGYGSEKEVSTIATYYARWDKNGKRVMTKRVAGTFDFLGERDIYQINYVVAKNGNAYILGEDKKITVLNDEGEVYYKVDIAFIGNTLCYDLTLDSENNAVLWYRKNLGNGIVQYVYSTFNDAKGCLNAETPLPSDDVITDPQFAPGHDVYWITMMGLYALDGDKVSTLLRWSSFDVPFELMREIKVIDADHIYIRTLDNLTGETCRYIATTDELEGRTAVGE